MKNLILILSLCFVLFSCFEKEAEVVPKEPPVEGNIMECEAVTEFIDEINSYPAPLPQSARATINKYKFENEYVYLLDPKEGSYWLHGAPIGINSVCDTVCFFSLLEEENTCPNWAEAEYIETIWKDER
ncbi:hypothetical protein [Bernardetia sp.]|uniref:hypothetical protein n=1 Tax=Bernardetia sp. TaxID=1937974 RepID=UPI0025BB88B7|nr:hypothetical protein [Bernardetia sp.]